MDIKPTRKKYTFNPEKVLNKRATTKKIANQSTLIGSYFKLMMNQKLVVALVRVKSNSKDFVVPIGFKVDEKMIPKNAKFLEIDQNNMVKVSIPGVEPIHAMLVVVADDSKDMFESYKIFISKSTELKLTNLQEKISNWFPVEGIAIEKAKVKSLPGLTLDTFEDICHHIASERRKEKGNPIRKIDEEKPGPSKKAKIASKESVHEIIDLDSRPDSQMASTDIDSEVTVDETDLVPLYELAIKIPDESSKKFSFGLMKVLGKMMKDIKGLKEKPKKDINEMIPADYSVVKGNEFKKIRIIPDLDKTFEKDNITYIEGILPVNAKKYRQAFKGKHPKNTELEPTAILNTMVKSLFPKHWAIGVTLRGAGENQSLISLWNYANPLNNPCDGTFENNLGEMRFRALLDHAMRKAGKHSYDKTVEKSLISSFSKSLHYCRKQFGPVKNENTSDEEEGDETSDSDVSDNADDRDFVPKAQTKVADSYEGNSSSPRVLIKRDEASKEKSAPKVPLKVSEVYDSDEADDNPFNFSSKQGDSEKEEGGSDNDQDQTLPVFADEPEDNSRRGYSQYRTGQKLREENQKDDENLNLGVRTEVVDIQLSAGNDTPNDSGIGSNAELSFSSKTKISSSQRSGKRSFDSTETIEERKKKLTSTPISSSFDKSQTNEKSFSSPRFNESPIPKKDSPINLSGDSQVVKSVFGNRSERFSRQLSAIHEDYQSRLIESMKEAEKKALQRKQEKSGDDNTSDTEPQLTEEEKAFFAKISGKMNITQILANLQQTKNDSMKDAEQYSSSQITSKYVSKKFKKNPVHSSQPIASSSKLSSNSTEKNTRIFQIDKNGEEFEVTKKLNSNLVYCIYLPNICNEKLIPIKLPILFCVEELQFLEFGFDVPFKDYFDHLNNNIERYPDWLGCEKMVGNSKVTLKIEHCPLASNGDIEFIPMDENELHELKKYICELDQHKESIRVKDSKSKDQVQRNESVKLDSSEVNSCLCANNGTVQQTLDTIKFKLDRLNERKKLLSALDINGSVCSEMIDVFTDIFKVLSMNESEEKSLKIQIPIRDNTYKDEKNNRIFIEGKVKFELDKYQIAIMKTKTKNPFSLAYQFVKLCFPESYFLNVTLGKKYYDKDEIREMFATRKTSKEKLPLAFVWGFKNPFDHPLEEPFNIIQGQERVRAFIDHIFRKSDILEYTAELENKVRGRLVKELFARNRTHSRDKEQVNDSEEQSDGDVSEIWESNLFK
uniref:Uncharacterized protein n=1 Tax=Tetranychus urticae TaxID=32264 RepID=T1KRP8_TETUR